MKRVLIESPFAGEIDRNQMYARFCSHHTVTQYKESPYASHLFFTQEFILDDDVPEERMLGIDAGLAWGEAAQMTVVYVDLGLSSGMAYGIANALSAEPVRRVDYRQLPEDLWEAFRLKCIEREYLVPERAYPPLTPQLIQEIQTEALWLFKEKIGAK